MYWFLFAVTAGLTALALYEGFKKK